MRAFSHLALLATLIVALPACGGSEPVDPVNNPPSFSVASVVVTLADNSQGLQFVATPNENVQLTEVLIRNPVGGTERFNGNNNVFLSNQPIALQNANFGFTRVSGNWTFTFDGQRPSGNQGSFNVVVSLPVSALTDGGLPTVTE